MTRVGAHGTGTLAFDIAGTRIVAATDVALSRVLSVLPADRLLVGWSLSVLLKFNKNPAYILQGGGAAQCSAQRPTQKAHAVGWQ